MPTLGEFIRHARRYGFSKRQVAVTGPRGEERIRYLLGRPRSFCGASQHSRERPTDAEHGREPLPPADMEGPAVKRFVTAPSISRSMLPSEHGSGERG